METLHPLFQKSLCSPRTHQRLRLVEDRLVSEQDGVSFHVHAGIPLMLDANSQSQVYAEHYRIDAEAFDYFEERDDPATAHDERRVQEAILRRLDASYSTVLDVGCGRAWVARTLCPRNITVCSMDISLANPTKARERYPYDNHCALVADAFALPFADGSLDAVIASEIIEHVPDPAAFVSELIRILRPGGSLIISTPYKEKIKYCLCIHCNRTTPLHAHIHSFDEHVLERLTPRDVAVQFEWEAFGNKALLFLRTYPLLQWMPHGLWRFVDAMANRLVNKRAHIVAEWRRTS